MPTQRKDRLIQWSDVNPEASGRWVGAGSRLVPVVGQYPRTRGPVSSLRPDFVAKGPAQLSVLVGQQLVGGAPSFVGTWTDWRHVHAVRAFHQSPYSAETADTN